MRYLRPPFLTILTLAVFTTIAQAQRGQFTVQVESAPSQAAAESRVQQLKARGLEAYWIKSDIAGVGLRYRVRIGRFPTRAAAKVYGEQLRRQGAVSDFFVAEYEAPAVAAVAPKKETPAPSSGAKPAPALPEAGAPKLPRVEPTDNASPKPTPAAKPRISSPPVGPLPTDRLRRPRDSVAEVVPTSSPGEKPLAEGKETNKHEVTPPLNKAAAAGTARAGAAATSAEFSRFEDAAYGYSFEYPRHWDGGKLSDDELQAQRIDAGVMYRSRQDAAFMNAIWNRLKGANSPSYDNNLIVDLVVKSLSSGAGFQGLTETARRVETRGSQINTFVDLRTMLSQPNAPAPLEFLGKAVIIRSSEGILLVVTFYSKNSAPSVAELAQRIVSSARVPE